MTKRVLAICLMALCVLCVACAHANDEQPLAIEEFSAYEEGEAVMDMHQHFSVDFSAPWMEGKEDAVLQTNRGIGLGSSASDVAQAYNGITAEILVETDDPLGRYMTLEEYLEKKDSFVTDEIVALAYDYGAVYYTIDYNGTLYSLPGWMEYAQDLTLGQTAKAAEDGELWYYTMQFLFTNDEVSSVVIRKE
ncbi:hypothetical protein LJC56_10220 [Christensenellaceae bacterium OttesenSCG-928-K19]|nr:hypothetical protein [Christensenellaceae bacterium OttesenSCG-928-K19]